jgi:hypothetical protein
MKFEQVNHTSTETDPVGGIRYHTMVVVVAAIVGRESFDLAIVPMSVNATS